MMNLLIDYFHAQDDLELCFLVLDGLVATAIFTMLLFSKMHLRSILPKRVRAIRFLLISSYGVLALWIWSGEYFTSVEPAHLITSSVVFYLVWIARGDISIIFDAMKIIKDDGAHWTKHCNSPCPESNIFE